ncbi:MAG: stage IV sporulation protein A [Lachnospira sp.]|nr:stage IV sporulation protein A [Lachnospira sp.]
MDNFNVYKDIKARTNGEIYIGVVGPVRTGKSTFIKRFMDLLVLPNIADAKAKEQARDELPQSSAGRTIMTTEPKFIPKEAVEITLSDDISMKVRMIDCVGYMVNGATGHLEEDKERLVHTPWFDYEIPFTKAAEIGTQKVIADHSTIGVVLTTDGSFGELPRNAYLEPEQRTISELKQLNKPFIVLLNTTAPKSPEALKLASDMEKQYQVSVVPINAEQLHKEDVKHILEAVVLEFPIDTIDFSMPKWVEILDRNHWLKENVIAAGKEILQNVNVMKDLYALSFPNKEAIEQIRIDSIDMANGIVRLLMTFNDKYYYEMISQMIDTPITNEYHFMQVLKEMAEKRKECEQVASAMQMVNQKGYGVVTPEQDSITVATPELIKHGSKYGIKIKAEAPSIHMIKANITTEIAPVIGTEQQAQELIDDMKADCAVDPQKIWEVNIFGKTIKQLVEEGLISKASKMNEDSQLKLQDTMEKIINDSNGGMVCIII